MPRPAHDNLLDTRNPSAQIRSSEALALMINRHLDWSSTIPTPFLSFHKSVDRTAQYFRSLSNTWAAKPTRRPGGVWPIQLDVDELARSKPGRESEFCFLVNSRWGEEILMWKSVLWSDVRVYAGRSLFDMDQTTRNITFWNKPTWRRHCYTKTAWRSRNSSVESQEDRTVQSDSSASSNYSLDAVLGGMRKLAF